jgi:hypothetical protein
MARLLARSAPSHVPLDLPQSGGRMSVFNFKQLHRRGEFIPSGGHLAAGGLSAHERIGSCELTCLQGSQ